MSIRLLLIDDHALFREGLVRLLTAEPDLEVAEACSEAKQAIRFLETAEVDLVLLDFELGEESAIDFVHLAKARGWKFKILVVTAGVHEKGAAEMIQAGVSGIFHKHNPPDELARCIRRIAAGEVWLEDDYLKMLFRLAQPEPPDARPMLTEREKTVLRCLFEGLPSKQIGSRLGITEGAVKGTLQQLFQKLGVRTRSQLVRLALDEYRDQLEE
jgi:two-component system, NarL family, nitrate/nitrite response regulator NarL